ncbi:MAG: ribose-5-phosphate isomerase RpiA [Chitinophagaceae bacterium]
MINPKQLAGEKAVEYLKNGMTIGLGTGSTAFWAIQEIGRRCKNGLQIKAVATSQQSTSLASELGIPLIGFSDIDHIDVDIDGADEIDSHLNLIKGGGGALLREKIIAANSHQFIVVADASKLVASLGKFPLPVEVTPFAWELTFRQLQALGGFPQLRKSEGKTFISDNGNYIIDCHLEQITHPQELQKELIRIPGVMEHGLFLRMATLAIIGETDGTLRLIQP